MLKKAKWAFPLNHQFRRAVADFCIVNRWKGSRPIAIAAVREAIPTDPFSPDLHRMLASLLFEDGDMEGARQEIRIFKALQPGRDPKLMININPLTN